MGIKMGLGSLSSQGLNFKRKFRWTLVINPYCTFGGGASTIGPNFVKVASRPNYDIEETELNYLNAKTWIAGKLTWQSITVTYIDCGSQDIRALYEWIGSNAQLDNDDVFHQGTSFGDYAAEGTLTLYNGQGEPMEVWKLKNLWPQAVNFGELDYSSSEEVTIELTLRYDAVVYSGLCPTPSFAQCVTQCVPVPPTSAQ